MKAVATSASVQLKNILFATDFSPAAEAAIPYAAEIAKRYNARLFALHVRAPLVNPMLPPVSWHSSLESARIETERQRTTLLDAFPGLQPEILIQEGDIRPLIQSVVEDKDKLARQRVNQENHDKKVKCIESPAQKACQHRMTRASPCPWRLFHVPCARLHSGFQPPNGGLPL